MRVRWNEVGLSVSCLVLNFVLIYFVPSMIARHMVQHMVQTAWDDVNDAGELGAKIHAASQLAIDEIQDGGDDQLFIDVFDGAAADAGWVSEPSWGHTCLRGKSIGKVWLDRYYADRVLDAGEHWDCDAGWVGPAIVDAIPDDGRRARK